MDQKKTTVQSRRTFLKKAAYAVPTVIALGQITNPTTAAASFVGGGTEHTGTTPSNPDTGSDRGDAYNLFGN
jgi:hypothetical protein